MNKKRNEKMKDIPSGDYCYDYETGKYRPCPFYSYKLTNRGMKFKKTHWEYCKLHRKYLYIQDQVKDCGLNMENNDE